MTQSNNDIRLQLRQLKTCVIVPTYNNRGTITQVLQRLQSYASDILVVNDGSTDDTLQLLQAYDVTQVEGHADTRLEIISYAQNQGKGHADTRLEIISYAQNQGKGHALRTGFRKAKAMGFDYAVTIDSDGQHYPEDMPRFVEKLQQCISEGRRDVLIVGNRKLQQENMPGGNTFANYFSNFWFALQTWQCLPDTQTGYRLYPLHHLHGLSLITARYEAELELMVLAAWHGVRLESTPIRVYYPPREERVTHFRPFWDFVRIFILNTVLFFSSFLFGWWMMAYYRIKKIFVKN